MTNGRSATKVVTGKVRASYASLLKPTAFENQDPKYSVVLLIPKSDKKTLAAIHNAQKAAYEAAKNDKLKGVAWERVKTTLRDGDTDSSVDPDNQPEYAHCYFINVSSKQKPQIVDREMNPLTDESEVYSGMYIRASINFYAYNTAGNKGISAGLNNVQKVADGDFLGGRSSAEDDFDEWDEDDENDALDGLM